MFSVLADFSSMGAHSSKLTPTHQERPHLAQCSFSEQHRHQPVLYFESKCLATIWKEILSQLSISHLGLCAFTLFNLIIFPWDKLIRCIAQFLMGYQMPAVCWVAKVGSRHKMMCRCLASNIDALCSLFVCKRNISESWLKTMDIQQICQDFWQEEINPNPKFSQDS